MIRHKKKFGESISFLISAVFHIFIKQLLTICTSILDNCNLFYYHYFATSPLFDPHYLYECYKFV